MELLAQQLKASLRGLLRLIVLEACEGARPGPFASAAETLVRAGADAVAHLWPVKADVARACSAELYRARLSPCSSASRERARDEALARDRLERFLPAGAADRILGAGATRIDVTEARVTALCCDIPGHAERTFTLSPRAAFNLLEEYLCLVEKAVFDDGGTLERAAGPGGDVWVAILNIEDIEGLPDGSKPPRPVT